MDYNRENMIDLNEENVRKIFINCIATEQTPREDVVSANFISSNIQTPIPSVQLSRSNLDKNSLNLLYLTGQLENVHSGQFTFHVNDGFKKYDGSYWTQDKMVMFSLYYLSCAAQIFPEFKPSVVQKTFISNLDESPFLKPTISPNDPKFEEWAKNHTAKVKKKSGGQEPGDN